MQALLLLYWFWLLAFGALKEAEEVIKFNGILSTFFANKLCFLVPILFSCTYISRHDFLWKVNTNEKYSRNGSRIQKISRHCDPIFRNISSSFEEKSFLVESWSIRLNFRNFSVGGCWGQPILLFWKLVDETQMSYVSSQRP